MVEKMNKEDTITFIRSLLISRKKHYELSEFLNDFKQENGFALPLYGYKNHLDFLKSIPDTVKLRYVDRDVLLVPVGSNKSKHIYSLIRRQNTTKCNKTTRRFGKNISCPSQNSTFSGNVNEFKPNVHAGGKFHYKRENINKKENVWKTCRRDLNIKNNCRDVNYKLKAMESKGDFHLTEEMHRHENMVSMNTIPCINILTDIHEIPKLDLETYAHVGEYLEVCVPEVCNPYKFSLQLRKFKVKLNTLMTEMQLFYKQNGEKYKFCHSDLLSKPEQLCVALYETSSGCFEWYRAVILRCQDNLKATVGLIDYGTVTEIGVRHLRYMHKQFGVLPPQAFSGCLGNLRPGDGNIWSQESSKKFFSMVFERDLLAGVIEIKSEKLWLSVALSYRDEKDVHISDTLINEGLAVLDMDYTDSGNSLTVTNKKWNHSFTHLDMKSLIHPEDIGRTRKSRCKPVLKSKVETFFSYCESNEKLLEMLAKCTVKLNL